MLVDEPWGGAH